ncbi:hypothetical protein [Paenibacillus terrae]|uniref:Uncharacterized protein n=1 Tax=Paenibacillus terrae TaxID=159743 RepID=A0A0D7WW57_9BACL|nr:hypothetical protein [Paenibacillus terrae]KJD42958.1 hypothetical protein QD47_25405 [Paenibacillus terrae]
MLKEQIENIEAQLYVFPDFKQISLQRGDMTELMAVLQAWQKPATENDKEDCEGAIEQLRNALDIRIER